MGTLFKNSAVSVYQPSLGFVGAGGSGVKVLPKAVEGDATFGPRHINLTQLSSSPSGPSMPSGESEAETVVYLCLLFFFSLSLSEKWWKVWMCC